MFFGINGCAPYSQSDGHPFDHFAEDSIFAIKMRCSSDTGIGLFLHIIERRWRVLDQRLLCLNLQAAQQFLLCRAVGSFQRCQLFGVFTLQTFETRCHLGFVKQCLQFSQLR